MRLTHFMLDARLAGVLLVATPLVGATQAARAAGCFEAPGEWFTVGKLPKRALVEGHATLDRTRFCLEAEGEAWCIDLCPSEGRWIQGKATKDAAGSLEPMTPERFHPHQQYEGVEWLRENSGNRKRLLEQPMRGPLVVRAGGLTLETRWHRANDHSRAPLTHFSGATLARDDRTFQLPEDGAPAPRHSYIMVRLPRGMLILGGNNEQSEFQRAGALYDWTTKAWHTIAPLPEGLRTSQWTTATWTGQRLLVLSGAGKEFHGAIWDPVEDSWRPVSYEGAPPQYTPAPAYWTGTELLYQGHSYSPAEDRWRTTDRPAVNTRLRTTAHTIGGWLLFIHRRTKTVGSGWGRQEFESIEEIAWFDPVSGRYHPIQDIERAGGHLFVGDEVLVQWGNVSLEMVDPGGGCGNHTGPEGCDPVPPSYALHTSDEVWVLPLAPPKE